MCLSLGADVTQFLCIDGPWKDRWVEDQERFETAVHVGRFLGGHRPANVRPNTYERVVYHRHRFAWNFRFPVPLVPKERFCAYEMRDIAWLEPFGLYKIGLALGTAVGAAFSVYSQPPDRELDPGWYCYEAHIHPDNFGEWAIPLGCPILEFAGKPIPMNCALIDVEEQLTHMLISAGGLPLWAAPVARPPIRVLDVDSILPRASVLAPN